jgi:hypothetical protein
MSFLPVFLALLQPLPSPRRKVPDHLSIQGQENNQANELKARSAEPNDLIR